MVNGDGRRLDVVWGTHTMKKEEIFKKEKKKKEETIKRKNIFKIFKHKKLKIKSKE